VLDEHELTEIRTIKNDLIVQTEGSRQVRRTVKLYNLDMILAIGYRVKSPRATRFRQWATANLKEYLVKGFVMDDGRLKDGDRWTTLTSCCNASATYVRRKSAFTKRSATCLPSRWTMPTMGRPPAS
jgi:hypothetical protein